MWIYNPGAEAATARIYLLARNTANPSPPSVDVLVAPGDTEKIDNAVESLFHVQVFGALQVTCESQKLVVTSRTYSKGAGAGEKDSVGQDFAGVPASFAIGAGEKTQVLGVHQTLPAALSDHRFNFGFVETTGHQATVRVSAFDGNGQLQGTKDLNVREFSQRQVAFKDHFPTVSTENVRLEMEVISGSGRIIAYGSGIANASQDPTTFEMTTELPAVTLDATLTGTGNAPNANGVVGTSNAVGYAALAGAGVYGFSGIANSVGVKGYAPFGNGVIGVSTGGGYAAVYGTNSNGYGGYFVGQGYFSGMLTKAGGGFKIDHPLDPSHRYLEHSFVESPDMKDVCDGVVTTDANGSATVTLPDWFGALNRFYRYQLTVTGRFAQAIVEQEIADNRFTIRTNLANVKVSWQVTGIRQDAWANAHRLVVEEPKPANEDGSYLHPELFGQPEEKSVEWARNPETMRHMREEPRTVPTAVQH